MKYDVNVYLAARRVMINLYEEIERVKDSCLVRDITESHERKKLYHLILSLYGPMCLPNKELIVNACLLVRTTNTLTKAGLVDMQDLRILSENDLKNIDGLGRKSFRDLKEEMIIDEPKYFKPVGWD